jgi:LPS sulfotransferase NodH
MDTLVNFIILSPPRSGSSYLRDLLNSHPDIYCEDEIFGLRTFAHRHFSRYPHCLHRRITPNTPVWLRPLTQRWNAWINTIIHVLQIRRNRFALAYIQAIRAHSGDSPCFGFKLLAEHHAGMKLLPMLGPVKLLLVKRRNIVKQAISKEFASQSNVWLTYSDQYVNQKQALSARNILEHIKTIQAEYAHIDQTVQSLQGDVMEIMYEDFFATPDSHLEKLADFLGVTPSGFDPSLVKLVKTTSPDLREMLTNFDEIYEALQEDNMKKMALDTDV